MREDPALLEEGRKTTRAKQHFMGNLLDFKLWDNVSEVVDEVLGKEDCYRMGQLPERASVLDFGANVGTFSIGMATRGSAVLAVEADLDSVMLLKRNIAVNQKAFSHGGNVDAVCAYVGDAGTMPLKLFYWKGPASYSPHMEVTTRLWDYLPSDLPRIIKMDIEESETELFKQPRALGCFAMAQHFLMEFHAFDGLIYKAELEALGYQVELAGCGINVPYNKTMSRGMLYAIK